MQEQRIMNQEEAEYFHHLHDTIILLGGSKEIAHLAANSDAIKPEDVDNLRNYNIKLIEAAKYKLSEIHSTKIRTML